MAKQQAFIGQVWVSVEREGVAVVDYISEDGVPEAVVQSGRGLRVGARIQAEWIAEGEYELPVKWQAEAAGLGAEFEAYAQESEADYAQIFAEAEAIGAKY